MITQTRVFQLIAATLTGDPQSATKAPGGIHQTLAPAGTTLTPWVIFAQQSPLPDIQAKGAVVVMGRGLITVQAVGPAGQGQAIQDCADWFDGLLNALLGASGGANVIRIARAHEIAYDELVQPAGVLYTHNGVVYRWWAQ